MSLVLHWGYSTNLNPIQVIGGIGVFEDVGVEDIVVVSFPMILIIRSSQSKDGHILFV